MNGSTVRYLTMMFLSDSLLVIYFSCFLLVLQIWYHRGISSDHKSHSNKFVQFYQNESFCMCLWMLWPVWSLSASKVYRTPDLSFHTVLTFVCSEASSVFTFFMNPLHQYLYPSNEIFQGFPVVLTCVEQESCLLESDLSISCAVMHHMCSVVLIFCFCLLHEDSIRGSVTFHFLILDEILLKIKFQFWFCYFDNKCIAFLLIEAISKLTWCHIWISTSSL